MNFMFEWQEQYLTTSEILLLPREHKIHIFELTCNVLFTIRKYCLRAFLMIFLRFPTTFRRFPKISKVVPKTRRKFPNIFREFPKMSEDTLFMTKRTYLYNPYKGIPPPGCHDSWREKVRWGYIDN